MTTWKVLCAVVLVCLTTSGCGVGGSSGARTVTVVPRTPEPTPENPELGDTWTRATDGMEMVFVPRGSFQMGAWDGELDEQPVHEVTVDAFWIDRTVVTNRQYADCVAAGGCLEPRSKRSYARGSYYGNPQFDDHAVVNVTWEYAVNYCAWAGARLPTEAEWEHAGAGPESAIYPWGSRWDPRLANVADTGGLDTKPVDTYADGASWCGAIGMAGGVWEWVQDWYAEDYYAESPAENPQGPDSGEQRVRKGGAFHYDVKYARCSARNGKRPGEYSSAGGFRCAIGG